MSPSINSNININFEGSKQLTLDTNIKLLDIITKTGLDPQNIYLAKVNNKVTNLHEKLTQDATIEWLDYQTAEVRRSNQQTICMLLIYALHEIAPSASLHIQHSLGDGLYCEVDGIKVTQQMLSQLEIKMQNYIEENHAIIPINLDFNEAINKLTSINQEFCTSKLVHSQHKLKLYQYKEMNVHLGYPLLASTKKISGFELKFWPPGLVLNVTPFVEKKYDAHPLKPKKLFQVFQEYREWEEILGIKKGDDLNCAIQNKTIYDLIKIAEGLHEKKVAQIADQITRDRQNLRIIFIAGPSSSGKTTFTKRLNIQLRVNGLKPTLISLDDYFIDKDKTPLDENGKPNFESIHALNIDRFNSDLSRLMNGEKIMLPRYDFISGKSVDHVEAFVPEFQPILIEGLHGLNESLSESIPLKNKIKIYVSALTQLNITDHLRVPTSDVRLMRRLIRDYQFRGYSAEHTLQMWPDVREGEERNIFPFQEEADIIFNSALVYEIPILLHIVRPLLERISSQHRIYPDAQRLLELYFCFLSLNPDVVPQNSILREFIGGSNFEY